MMDLDGCDLYHVTGQFKPGSEHARFKTLLVVRSGIVMHAGPTLAMMKGWSLSRVHTFIAQKETLKLKDGSF